MLLGIWVSQDFMNNPKHRPTASWGALNEMRLGIQPFDNL